MACTIRIDKDRNVQIETTYYRHFDWRNGQGGFSFPCDENGNVDTSELYEPAKVNLQSCLDGTYDVIDKGVEKYEHKQPLCPCGSGEHFDDVHDARGIFVARVCDKCRKERLSRYRPEIFTDSDYETDEPIDDTDW